MTRSSEKSATETGEMLRQLIKGAGETQSSLARATNTTAVYVSHWVTGNRVPSGGWVDIIATGLKLTEDQKVALHRAAAKDHGFKIDLT